MAVAKKKQEHMGRCLNESPAVISMMSTVVSSGGSLDSAVRYVASKGPSNTAKLFREIVSRIDCRMDVDMRDSLCDLGASLPNSLASFRRALFMVISASETSEPAERSRLLKEATDVALLGLKQTGEEYSSKLQTPCMVVFGLGIMVPMILLSLAPMLGMGDAIGMSMTIPEGLLERIILVFVPAAVASIILSIRGKNPLIDSDAVSDGVWKVLPMMLAIPLYMMLPNYGIIGSRAIALSLIVPSIVVLALVYPDVSREKVRRKIENAMKDALFDLGNRLTAGENFESASVGALTMRKECRALAESLSREYIICRGDLESAIGVCIRPVSPMMADHFCDICRAASRDIRDAGRLATAMAHQHQDRDSARKAIENKLRSMTDMMNGTAAVFAPLILGMSIMMMGPLSAVSGAFDSEAAFMTVSVYIVELAALISMFSSLLASRFRAVDVISRFAMTVPIAMAILLVCSSIVI